MYSVALEMAFSHKSWQIILVPVARKSVLPELSSYEWTRQYTVLLYDQSSRGEVTCQVYTELRRESAVSHGMPIAVRHLESIIRMSEAHARMYLREYVNEDDVDTAIRYALGKSKLRA